MIELSLTRAKELLAEAVAEKGAGYIYVNRHGQQADDGTVCHYVHGDEPGCIVGHVLHKAGVSLAALSEYEGQGAEELIAMFTSATYDTMRLLSFVQEYQDRGTSWGESVRKALARLESDT